MNSRTAITAWSQLFRIVGYELCIPVLNLLNIPQNMRENPERLLEISKFFFTGNRGIPLDEELSTESEAANYFEACRMVDLGHLYECFGRLVVYYGGKPAEDLYELGRVHFVDDLSRFWDIWHTLFLRMHRNDLLVRNPLGDKFGDWLIKDLTRRFKEETDKQNELTVKWLQICDSYSSDLEKQRNKLNELLWYDIRDPEFTNEGGFENPCDELNWVFDIESMIERDCAIRIWKDLNQSFDNKTRSDFFDLSARLIADINEGLSREINESKNCYLDF